MQTTNIIFLDTEFTNNDPYTGELLSIGMVKYSGEECYLELEFDENQLSDWVKQHVIPHLHQAKISPENAIQIIKDFVGADQPYVISYVYLYDIAFMHKLFNSQSIDQLPFHWIPLDFASMLYAYGYPPEAYKRPDFLEKIGVDTQAYPHNHNALTDAILLRQTYLKFNQYHNQTL